MSEWTKKRKCEDCGNQFKLSDHGSSSARETAKTLKGGLRSYDKNTNYILANKCPACYKKFLVATISKVVKK